MSDREPHFDPRRAALNHAGMASESANRPGAVDHTLQVHGQQANAIACGLVYIGDVLENRLSAIENLLEQLDVTVNNALVAIAEAVDE